MGVLCTWVKLVTDLQLLGCELLKNAFGGQAPPEPAGGTIALPRLPSRCKGSGGRRGEVGNKERGEGEGRGEGREKEGSGPSKYFGLESPLQRVFTGTQNPRNYLKLKDQPVR